MTNKMKAYLEAARSASGPSPEQQTWVLEFRRRARFWAYGIWGALGLGLVALFASGAMTPRPGPPSAAESAAVSPAIEADALMVKFKELAATCDGAGPIVEAALERPGMRLEDIYSLAKAAEDDCGKAHRAITFQLDPPASADGPTRERFTEVLETCQFAYYSKKHAYQALAEGIDTGMRPSKVAEFKSYASDAQSGLLGCMAGLMSEVKQAGGSQSGLGEADATPPAAS